MLVNLNTKSRSFLCVQSHNRIVFTGRHSEKWGFLESGIFWAENFKCENEKHIGEISGICASIVVEWGTRQNLAGPNKIVEGTDTKGKPLPP